MLLSVLFTCNAIGGNSDQMPFFNLDTVKNLSAMAGLIVATITMTTDKLTGEMDVIFPIF